VFRPNASKAVPLPPPVGQSPSLIVAKYGPTELRPSQHRFEDGVICSASCGLVSGRLHRYEVHPTFFRVVGLIGIEQRLTLSLDGRFSFPGPGVPVISLVREEAYIVQEDNFVREEDGVIFRFRHGVCAEGITHGWWQTPRRFFG
jgi:hypothetical protein